MKAPWISVIGWSRSGKTTLLEQLVARLHQRGLCVAAVKHSRHGHELHKPGSDTARLQAAGAAPIGLATPDGLQLTFPQEPAPALPSMFETLAPDADLVLVEGWKDGPFPKIEVWRRELGPLLATGRSDVLAVVSDEPLPPQLHRFAPQDVPQLADFIMQWLAERVRTSGIDSTDGEALPAGLDE
jgi:molybdopterin-guanine dinucleotide biosynthesis protein MobB